HRGPTADARVLDLEHAARGPLAELAHDAVRPDHLADDRRARARAVVVHAVQCGHGCCESDWGHPPATQVPSLPPLIIAGTAHFPAPSQKPAGIAISALAPMHAAAAHAVPAA